MTAINLRNELVAMITGLLLIVVGSSAAIASQKIKDQYPGSVLYQKPVEVIPHVWSAIGATAPPGYENSGHNNNLSFIITGDGVVVVNAGATNELARALHAEIKAITKQPVKLVINENGQGHAMLGNGYWADQGVPILAHKDAAHEFKERGADVLDAMKRYNRDKAGDSRVQLPTEILEKQKLIKMGDFEIEVRDLGPAHSPGDVVVWLPKQRLVISGDMAFHERLLHIFDETGTAAWIESWKNFEKLGALYVIPGHGHPTNMAQVRRYTHDYLVYLRAKIKAHIDKGGTLKDAYYVDQSPYAYLDTFNELAKRNAGRVYEQMEFE
jgi:glyoxylase-like metal-dependent hydrolase (beta-lactamase superfamily II)